MIRTALTILLLLPAILSGEDALPVDPPLRPGVVPGALPWRVPGQPPQPWPLGGPLFDAMPPLLEYPTPVAVQDASWKLRTFGLGVVGGYPLGVGVLLECGIGTRFDQLPITGSFPMSESTGLNVRCVPASHGIRADLGYARKVTGVGDGLNPALSSYDISLSWLKNYRDIGPLHDHGAYAGIVAGGKLLFLYGQIGIYRRIDHSDDPVCIPMVTVGLGL